MTVLEKALGVNHPARERATRVVSLPKLLRQKKPNPKREREPKVPLPRGPRGINLLPPLQLSQ